jgi:hypothetical protein
MTSSEAEEVKQQLITVLVRRFAPKHHHLLTDELVADLQALLASQKHQYTISVLEGLKPSGLITSIGIDELDSAIAHEQALLDGKEAE